MRNPKKMSGCARAAFGSETRTTATIFAVVLVLGAALAAAVPNASSLRAPWRFWSNLIGWTYFAAWSVSFWPQVILIAQRGRVAGLSFDFLLLNLLGFSAYSAYNCALFWNPAVRAQYAVAHPSSPVPTVALNDVFFGLHAVGATIVSIVQCAIYPRDAGQRVTAFGAAWAAVLLAAIVIYAAVVAAAPGGADAATGAGARGWLAFLTFVSYVKLAISLTKYVPQVVLNARNKSTRGWSIHNVLLDFTGGMLSVAQLFGDASQQGWDAV